jgi:hypothetical protein
MTGPEMNAPPTKKMMRRMIPVLAGVSAALALSGCVAAVFDPATDASSPVAPRVQAMVDANRTYPRWENFPPSPQNLPTAVELAARVNTLRATSGALAGEVERLEWTLGDPAAFQRDVDSRLDASRLAPATARTAAEIEAYAASLRERAKAPPPIPRR